MDIKGTMQKIVAGTGIVMVTVFAGKVMMDENDRREKAFNQAQMQAQKAKSGLQCEQGKTILAAKRADRLDNKEAMQNVAKTEGNSTPPAQQKGQRQPSLVDYPNPVASSPEKNGQEGNAVQPNRPSQNMLPVNQGNRALPQRQQQRNVCSKPSSTKAQQPDTLPQDHKQPSQITTPETTTPSFEHESEPENEQPDISGAPKKLWVDNQSPLKPEEDRPSRQEASGQCYR